MQSESVYQSVSEYYGRVLGGTKDLLTSACCTANAPPPVIRAALNLVPEQVKNRYYGCGIVVPLGITGKTVLDLGSGSGLDCYVCAALVGPKGRFVGVDMTEEQLKEKAFGYDSSSKPKLEFVQGYLEALDQAGIAAESIDIAISNCVINLSPDKPTVLKQVYRVLKSGGEFYFSDVFCDRRLPEKVRADRILYGECISGALYINDFLNAAHSAGFADVRWVESREIEVSRPEHKALIGDARFSSITWRCFKVDDLELSHENYGQSAQYKGTISEDAEYVFDQIIRFKKGEKVSVCGNTAKILSHSWLGAHFDVFGDQSVHFGQFEGSHPSILQKDCSDSGSSCCPGETAKSACC